MGNIWTANSNGQLKQRTNQLLPSLTKLDTPTHITWLRLQGTPSTKYLVFSSVQLHIAMAAYLILSLVLLVGQVQCQETEDEAIWEREFDIIDSRIPRAQTDEACYGKAADIFFILDSSTSIWINDYRDVLQFTRDIVSRLDISQRNTRVGLVTFSDNVTRPALDLNRFQTKNDLLTGITEQTLPYRTGVTNTHLAISYVRQNTLFREGVTKVIVVVTDGGSRSPGTTTREADLARDQGFYVFVIGVGQYQEVREWQNIASDPDSSFVFNVTNYGGLNQVQYTLPVRICNLPPLDVSRRCNIGRNAEVFFVAGPAGTQDAVHVIDRFVELTTDSNNQLRVSYLLDICENAENVPLVGLTSYCDRNRLTRPANADTFVQLLRRLRTIAAQARRGNKQVAVVFIEEESLRLNRQGLINEAVNIGQRDNVEIILVDLGSRISQNEIINIASYRQNAFTFAPRSVASQQQLLNALLDKTCTVINGETFTFDPVRT